MRRNRTVVLALSALGVFLGSILAEAPSPEPPPDVDCRLSGSGKLATASGPRGLLVSVNGTVNEGSATLAFRAAPPRRLTFRFANLRGLHAFTLTDGKRTCQASFALSGGKAHAYFDAAGKRVSGPALAAVQIAAEIGKNGDSQVVVSIHGGDFDRDVRCQWVQYYLIERVGFVDS